MGNKFGSTDNPQTRFGADRRMFDSVLKEEALQFGEGGRLFGILTSPVKSRTVREMPVIVFLSAGFLHRVGPFRLHVRLARELARLGFTSLRVDLAGTGDSQSRRGLSNQQSVAADFAEIVKFLESRVGRLPLILAGLCSGADNAIRLVVEDFRIVGMILLDPFCFQDRGFGERVLIAKYSNPARYAAWLKRRIIAFTKPGEKVRQEAISVDPLSVRDLPTREQLRAAFGKIYERKGRVLSIFTRYATGYYNRAGQLNAILNLNGYKQFGTELFWPHVDHTYTLELHRRRLIEEIKTWASHYVPPRESARMRRSPFESGGILTLDSSFEIQQADPTK